jgi:hypothetical protein
LAACIGAGGYEHQLALPVQAEGEMQQAANGGLDKMACSEIVEWMARLLQASLCKGGCAS